ncbi:MAG TPA: MFS transporter [Hyphomicrobiaceae bacterium]|nr:MFS transporter [Hyphomicrobiaceae bacterium]
MTAAWLSRPLVRFALLYCALYLAFGTTSPFLPAFLETRGIAAEQLGVIFAAGTAVRLLAAPMAARLADGFGALRFTLAACSVIAAIAALCYLPAAHFQTVLIVSLFQAAALAPTANLADALALAASKAKSGEGFEYGWVRGTGSAAFIVGAVLAGATISAYGLAVILWWQAALLSAVPLAVRQVPPAAIPLGDVADSQPRFGLMTLAEMPAFRRVVLIAALVLGSHAMHDTFAMIRWRAAGISPWETSLLWSVAVAAEVIVFFLIGPWLVAYLTPPGSLALAAACGAIRWGITALFADVVSIALTQPLHGFTFALLHLASMQLIAQVVPQRLAATAQAVYGTVGIGAATAGLILISGWLYARLGPQAFLCMSLLCLGALPLTIGLPSHDRPGPSQSV